MMLRVIALASAALVPAEVMAQPTSLEQRVGAEIGQCVIQRAGLAYENETLKARIAALEKQIAEAKKPE